MDTSHINKVKTPQHDGTPRSRVLDVLHEIVRADLQVFRHRATGADRQRFVAASFQPHGFGHGRPEAPRVRRVDEQYAIALATRDERRQIK